MQTREQIKLEMQTNAMLIRQGFAPVPLQLEPLVLQHDDLFDPPKSLLEQEEEETARKAVHMDAAVYAAYDAAYPDLRVVCDLLDESETPEGADLFPHFVAPPEDTLNFLRSLRRRF
jgi:hypothetical protein